MPSLEKIKVAASAARNKITNWKKELLNWKDKENFGNSMFFNTLVLIVATIIAGCVGYGQLKIVDKQTTISNQQLALQNCAEIGAKFEHVDINGGESILSVFNVCSNPLYVESACMSLKSGDTTVATGTIGPTSTFVLPPINTNIGHAIYIKDNFTPNSNQILRIKIRFKDMISHEYDGNIEVENLGPIFDQMSSGMNLSKQFLTTVRPREPVEQKNFEPFCK